MLENITPEQRQAYLEQGRIARQEKIKWAETNLDMEYGEDEAEWRRLFALYGVRAPQKHIPATEVKYLKRMVKTVGADMQAYMIACGTKNVVQLAKMNPRENALASCGYFIEYWYELQTTDTLYPVEYEED